MNVEDLTLDVEQNIEIEAPPEKVFESLLRRFGSDNTQPDGTPMPMVLEPRAGGRWYRDRGAGIEHLWGFVQVIKPPTLLELSGPLFMSYPAINHIEIKVRETDAGGKCHAAAQGDWHDRAGPQKRLDFRLDARPDRAQEGLRVVEELDPVWKALADPTRRGILDLLRVRPRTTTELVESFPKLSRFGVMKHIEVLRAAQLVQTRESGRYRVNSLNAVPIRQIYERWVSRYEEVWADHLLRLKEVAEREEGE